MKTESANLLSLWSRATYLHLVILRSRVVANLSLHERPSAYVTGEQLHKLRLYCTRAIHDNFGLDFDGFWSRVQGPLSVITAMGINELYGKQVQYCSNRKKQKDHGADAGMLLGAQAGTARVVMVEDVCMFW